MREEKKGRKRKENHEEAAVKKTKSAPHHENATKQSNAEGATQDTSTLKCIIRWPKTMTSSAF